MNYLERFHLIQNKRHICILLSDTFVITGLNKKLEL